MRDLTIVVTPETLPRRRDAFRVWRLGVNVVLISLCVLFGGLSCPEESAKSPVPQPITNSGEISIFFTGSELGALKPCGCSGGQLGGLSKRTAVFDRAPAGRRLIVDTGTLVAGQSEQDQIKFRILFEAFSLLDYDVVNLTDEDVEMARMLGLAAPQRDSFVLVGAPLESDGGNSPRSFVRQFLEIKGGAEVRLVSLDAREDQRESAAAAFGTNAVHRALNVLILRNGDAQSARTWAQSVNADCIICPSDSDEPQVLSEPGERPLVFTVGRFGRHISRLRVNFSDASARPTLSLEDIPVGEDLPEDEALVKLYRQYQELVGQSHLLEKYPRIPLPDDLRYVGSASCEHCHSYEYDKWSDKAHADAFATLVEVGSDRDPECVICHVVGMDRESGFVTEEQTPHLKDVGCENCHGPGSEHVQSGGQTPTTEPKMTCLDCHTPEHSSGYAGHEAEFLEKIKHWREP